MGLLIRCRHYIFIYSTYIEVNHWLFFWALAYEEPPEKLQQPPFQNSTRNHPSLLRYLRCSMVGEGLTWQSLFLCPGCGGGQGA